MNLKVAAWIGCMGLVAGGMVTVKAGEFEVPAEGPVAFRRDKLPLDESSISGLSKQLEVLVLALEGKTAEERRTAAQMLALSLSLDPGNGKARELMREFQEGRHKAQVDAEQLEKTRARVWRLISWLETPDAGVHGRALANCLRDVMAVSDSGHPGAREIVEAGEKGAWGGWVPALAAFKDEKKGEPPHEEVVKNPDPEPKLPQESVPQMLESAKITTVLWKNTGTPNAPKWVLGQASLEMSAHREKEERSAPEFSLRIGSESHAETFRSTQHNLMQLLAKEYVKLPKGVAVTIGGKQLEESLVSKKKQVTSAACAVLAGSALSGVEPDAIVLGQIDAAGNYKIGSGFWLQIRGLGKGTGRRLIIPADGVDQVVALLGLENPGFFMEYEVVSASNYKELMAFAAKTPTEPYLAGLSKFREIREKSNGQDLRQYIANRFIRQRLAEVSQLLNNTHVSARLLLVQAEGKRPTTIPRKVLAHELRSALEPMDWLLNANDWEEVSAAKLGSTYDSCRDAIDALERYAEKFDRELIEQCRDVVVEIRTIERAARSRGESYQVKENVRRMRQAFVEKAKALHESLTEQAGESAAR